MWLGMVVCLCVLSCRLVQVDSTSHPEAAGMSSSPTVQHVSGKNHIYCFFCSTCRPLMCVTWLSTLKEVMYLIIFKFISRWDVSSSVQRWRSTRNLTCRYRKLMQNVNVDVRPKTWGPKPSQSCPPAFALSSTFAVLFFLLWQEFDVLWWWSEIWWPWFRSLITTWQTAAQEAACSISTLFFYHFMLLPHILHSETRKNREEQELCSDMGGTKSEVSHQQHRHLQNQDVKIKGNISDYICHNIVIVP